MADLVGQYFQGVAFGDQFYNGLINQRHQQAKERILLDGAQMQLEDDYTVRPDRINSTLAELRDATNLHDTRRIARTALFPKQLGHDAIQLDAGVSTAKNTISMQDQQRRIREILDGLTVDTEGKKLLADNVTAGNNIEAGRYTYDVSRATRPARLATAVTQAETDRAMAETGNIEANTQYNATNANVATIQQGKTDAIRANANNANLGLQLTEFGRNDYAVEAAKRRVNDEIALSGVGTPEDIRMSYKQIAEDPNRPPEDRIAARQMFEQLSAQTPNQAEIAQKQQVLQEIYSSPATAAIRAGFMLYRDPNDPNRLAMTPQGEYLMDDGTGQPIPVSTAELQLATAKLYGLDASAFSDTANNIGRYRAQSTYGVSNQPSILLGAPPNANR